MEHGPFSHLPKDAFRKIAAQKGDVIFRQNQPTTGLYCVINGCITLQRTGLGGDTITLHRAVTGGFFAEASIFSETYHCDAICTESGQLLKIAKVEIIKALRENSHFNDTFIRLLAGQVQTYRAHIELLAIHSATDRVLAAIHAGYLNASVKEFATRINLTHEACYRALRKLCNDGRITQIGRGQYELV